MFTKSVLTSIVFFITSAIAETVTEGAITGSKTYSQYTPFELSQMTLVERLKVYPWTVETMSIGLIVAYLALFFIGSKYNDNLVKKYIELQREEVLKDQFYQVGVTQNQLYIKDDGENYSSYATGRVNIASLTQKFRLQARHNVFLWILEAILSAYFESVVTPADTIQLTFDIDAEAAEKYDNFIWAVVSKDKMSTLRTESYYLSLTKTAESEKLPIEYVFMNEVPEMNEILYKSDFKAILEESKDFLRYIAITDQPDEKPTELSEVAPKKKVIVNMRVPKGDSQLKASVKLVKYVIGYIDFIVEKAAFRPELTRRIKKTRDAEISKLKKIVEDAKKEELEAKRIEEQKKLREEQSKLSPEEQKKIEKKQQEKKQRKLEKKQRVRG